MDKKVFDIVADTVGEALGSNAFQRQEPKDGMSVTFMGEDIAYKIIYEKDTKRFNLMVCDVDDGAADNKWKSMSVWLYDPETDNDAEAKSIANDFVETIQGPKQVAVVRAKKKKKKDDDNNVDPLFFFNRFVGVFPELKSEITEEREKYGDVRAVAFTRASLLPRLNNLCLKTGEDTRIKKICSLLNDMYLNGDLDVRSVITIVIINGLEKEALIRIEPLFNDELKKACKAALKIKGKKFKPEKRKKRKSIVAKALDSSTAYDNR